MGIEIVACREEKAQFGVGRIARSFAGSALSFRYTQAYRGERRAGG